MKQLNFPPLKAQGVLKYLLCFLSFAFFANSIFAQCSNLTSGGTISGAQISCGQVCSVTLGNSILPSGGEGTIEYMWLSSTTGNTPVSTSNGWVVITGAISETYSPGCVSSTTYFIRCARRSGCTSYIGESNIVGVVINPKPVATCSSVNGTGGGALGSASVSVSGGTAPYTYLWSNGAKTASISSLASGTYSVTVTDAKGCTATCSRTITNVVCSNVTSGGTINGSSINCGPVCNVTLGSVTLPAGGVGTIEYLWLSNTSPNYPNSGNNGWVAISNSNSSSLIISGCVNATTYYIRCARRNGCTSYVGESNMISVIINPKPTANCSSVNGTGGGALGSASVTVTGGTSPYTYLWSNGATSESISGLASGTYSVTVTDFKGCTATCSTTVTNVVCSNVTSGGTITGDQASCGPVCTVTLGNSVLPSGGSGTIEYIWLSNSQNITPVNSSNGWVTIPGATSSTYSPGCINETTYYIRCARRSNCTSYVGESNIVEVVINPVPVVTCSSTKASGPYPGSASVTATGGTPPYTYEWKNGIAIVGTTASVSVGAGTYTVTVTDGKGCTAVCSTTVISTPCSNITNGGIITGSQVVCGEACGIVLGTGAPATGGLGIIEYIWLYNSEPNFPPLPGNGWIEFENSNSETFTVPGCITETTYFVRCARRTGVGITCGFAIFGESNMVTVVVNPKPTVTCSSVNGNGNGNLGSASVTVSGGATPYTYLWSNGATTASISGLVSGTYSVTVTDAKGCTSTCSTTVTNVVCSNVTSGGTINGSITNCGPVCNVTFGNVELPSGGVGDLEYIWLSNAQLITPISSSNGWVVIPGATSSTYSPGCVNATTYYIRCARRNGCTSYIGESNIVSVIINAVPTATCSSVNGTGGGNLGSASVAVTGGTSPYTYLWSNGATTSAITGLITGTYSVTVTDAKGCTATCSTAVTNVVCSNVTSGGTINGSIINCGPACNITLGSATLPSGGVGDLEYVWLSNTSPNYPNNGNNGWVAISNSNSSSLTISGCVNATTYYIRCARRNGCTSYVGESNMVSVIINPKPTATCTSVNGTGGGALGSASVTVTGGTSPYTYLWSNGAVTASISGLVSGTYSVTVTDAKGCTATCSRTITNVVCSNVTSGGTINGSSTNCGPVCNVTLGSVTLPAGGVGTIEYVWLSNSQLITPVNTANGWVTVPGATSSTYSPGCVNATTYYIRCARRNGCTSYVGESNIVSVIVNPKPTANCTSVNGTGGGALGSASVTVTGGTSPYTYLWSNGGTAASISGLASGTYSVTVTDFKGCTATCSTTVTNVVCSNVTSGGTITGDQASCGPVCTVTLGNSVLPSGGSGTIEYIWLSNSQNITPVNSSNGWVTIPGATSSTYSPGCINETTYFIRCARRSNCSDYIGESNIVEVVINPAPIAICTSTRVSGEFLGTATVTVTGGTAPYSYLWSNGAITASIQNLGTGIYSVTVTDDKGCIAVCSTTVTSTPCSNITNGGIITGNQVFCEELCEIVLGSTAPAIGGIGTIEYLWLYNSEPNFPPLPGGGWVEIPNSNSASITLDTCINETTYYVRCARRTGVGITCGFAIFGESNMIEVKKNNLSATCSVTAADCVLGGSVTVTPTGGVGAYTYNWTNSAGATVGTTQTVTGLSAGFYTVTVKDATNCEADCTAEVKAPPINQAPYFAAAWKQTNPCGLTVQATKGLPVSFTIFGKDPEGQNVTLSIVSGMPAGAVMNPMLPLTTKDSVKSIFSWVPTAAGLYTITYKLKDACSEVQCVVVINVKEAGQPLICSYTQGFFGNAGGKHCGTETTTDLLNRLVSPTNPLILGLTSANRSIKFSNGSCILTRLPGGGSSVKLPAGNITCENPTGIPLQSGKFKNTLLSQILTLALNVRLSPNLGSLQLTTTSITTAKATGCNPATSTPVSGTNATFTIPAKVISYLNSPANGLSFGNTVNSLLELANKALAGTYVGGTGKPSLGEIATAADMLNNGFDECRILVSGAIGSRISNTLPQEFRGNIMNVDNVKIYPNPVVNNANIEVVSKASGKVSIEIIDMQGKVVKNLYSTDVKKGERLLINLDVNGWASGVYNCRISTPDGQFNRKIVVGGK